jgi:hypothetical protein
VAACLKLARRGDIDVVLLELAPPGEDGVDGGLRVRRVLEGVIGEHLLGLGRGQELDELDGVGAVLRVGGDAGAGDIDVRPRRLLIGPERRHDEGRVLGHDAREVVGIGDPHVALSRRDGLEDLGVAIDEDGLVGGPRLHDRLGLRLALALDHRRHERLVVDIARGPEAEAAFPLRIAERIVGRQLLGLHLLGVVHDGPRPHGETGPPVLGIAQVSGDIRHDLRRVHSAQESGSRRIPQVARVDADEDIGGRLVSLRLQALEELRGIAAEGLHLDARLLGERVEDQLGPVLGGAGRVHDDFLSFRDRTQPEHQPECGHQPQRRCDAHVRHSSSSRLWNTAPRRRAGA